MGPENSNCCIVLTNRLVHHIGVIPALKHMLGLSCRYYKKVPYIFCIPANFDNDKNASAPMLKLIESELSALVSEYINSTVSISERQSISVHITQKLNSVIGDTAFGYQALITGVLRAIEDTTFAIGFTYYESNQPLFIQAVRGQSSTPQFIERGHACIITKRGTPVDNNESQTAYINLAFKITRLEDVECLSKLCFKNLTAGICTLTWPFFHRSVQD